MGCDARTGWLAIWTAARSVVAAEDDGVPLHAGMMIAARMAKAAKLRVVTMLSDSRPFAPTSQ
jgi:hypothetical protein